MNFLLGLFIVACGVLIVMKTEAVYGFFGNMAFFDRYLGAEGGSRLGYKLLGILAIFIGTLIMTGLIGGFMNWLLAPLLKYNQPR